MTERPSRWRRLAQHLALVSPVPLILMGVLGWAGGPQGALWGFLLSAPALLIAMVPTMAGLAHDAFRWMARSPLRQWQGNYYAFNDVQVRIYEERGELWFALEDVLDASCVNHAFAAFLQKYPEEWRKRDEDGEVVANVAALERLLGARDEHEAKRFIRWVRWEVVRPWRKKCDLAGRAPEGPLEEDAANR